MTHDALTIIGAIFQPDDWIEVRSIRSRFEIVQHWIKLAELDELLPALQHLNDGGHNIYFGVNPRPSHGATGDNSIITARAVFADFDDGVTPTQAAMRVRDADLPDPSILLSSGGGTHAYWLLDEPCTDMALWRRTQQGIIAAVQSDSTIHNPERIMRMPGFVNRKPERHAAPAYIVECHPDRQWSLAEFPVREAPPKSPPTPALALNIDRLQEEQRRAIARMRGIRTEDGQDGSRRLYTCGCIAVEHNLDATAFIEAVRAYESLRPFPCQWSDAQIVQRMKDAEKRVVRGCEVKGNGKVHITSPNSCKPGQCRKLTDLGNAERLIDAHGIDLHYIKAIDRWLVWDGHRWNTDETGEIYKLMAGVVRNIYVEAQNEPDEDKRKAIAKHAAASESRSRITSAIFLAQWQPSIPITPDDLDQQPHLVNTPSGTFDITTGELRDAARSDLCTKITGAAFDLDAEAPHLDGLLATIFAGHAETVDYLQRAFGYCATGYVREQVMFMAYGTGRNGKTTLFDAAMHALGDYACKGAPDILALRNSDDHPTNIAALQGKRLVVLSEVDEGMRWNEAKMKELTGETRLKARVMRGDWFDFEATHKLCVFGNSKPRIQGTDLGTWRRIRLVPFEQTIPEDKVDSDYPDKLKSEAAGILLWILEGAARWWAGGLNPPKEVVSATAGYRSESDNIGLFINDRCLLGALGEVSAKALREAYTAWCEDNGERPRSQRKVHEYLKTLDLGESLDSRTRRKIWTGITLTA